MSTTLIDQLAQRLKHIRQTIPETVRLIAVTKQVPVEVMQAAYELGIRDFGESRMQEAAAKQAQFNQPDMTWHLIGHLQTNKAAKVIEHFEWIHSLDSLRLAQRLDQLMSHQPTHLQPIKLCLQVKLRLDPNKYGWTVPELLAALPELEQCRQLHIVGLMTIPPYDLPEAETLAIFEETRELAQQIRQQSSLPIQELSMGMSDDYKLAIQAGATMIRLGRTLFGQRT
jgi:pyridoxal phosphate enzyme (YggS family)